MPSTTITQIRKPPSGKIYFRFGKAEREFESIAAAREWARNNLPDDPQEFLQSLAICMALQRQPALGNPAALEGRTLTIDLTQANWGTVS